MMRNLNPAAAISSMDANTVQGLLTAKGQAQINAMLAQAPPAMQGQLKDSFALFLDKIRVAFSGSISHVFLVGTIMMAVALVCIFFLPQIPLRKSKSAAFEEASREVYAELGGETDAENEPD